MVHRKQIALGSADVPHHLKTRQLSPRHHHRIVINFFAKHFLHQIRIVGKRSRRNDRALCRNCQGTAVRFRADSTGDVAIRIRRQRVGCRIVTDIDSVLIQRISDVCKRICIVPAMIYNLGIEVSNLLRRLRQEETNAMVQHIADCILRFRNEGTDQLRIAKIIVAFLEMVVPVFFIRRFTVFPIAGLLLNRTDSEHTLCRIAHSADMIRSFNADDLGARFCSLQSRNGT